MSAAYKGLQICISYYKALFQQISDYRGIQHVQSDNTLLTTQTEKTCIRANVRNIKQIILA